MRATCALHARHLKIKVLTIVCSQPPLNLTFKSCTGENFWVLYPTIMPLTSCHEGDDGGGVFSVFIPINAWGAGEDGCEI